MGYLSFGPIGKIVLCFCDVSVREKDWRSRAGSRRLGSTLAPAPVLFAHAVVTAAKIRRFSTQAHACCWMCANWRGPLHALVFSCLRAHARAHTSSCALVLTAARVCTLVGLLGVTMFAGRVCARTQRAGAAPRLRQRQSFSRTRLLQYRGIPKFWTYGSVCCACAQRPGLPRACHSS